MKRPSATRTPDTKNGTPENKVGYHRRNLLVPLPRFESLAQHNEEFFRLSEEDHRREHYRKNSTITALHQEDKTLLRPCPKWSSTPHSAPEFLIFPFHPQNGSSS